MSPLVRNQSLTFRNISMKNVVHIFIFIIVLFGIPYVVNAKKKKKTPDCSACKNIANNFNEGLKKTQKGGFGGGNTNWEEKSLGSFDKSETRLVEIMEDHICKGSEKQCHSMVEEYEDYIEAFWFKEFAKNENHNFLQWFCIDNVKACCPENTYGENCDPCVGHPSKVCSGNGRCDGDGTREGTGKCNCNAGYRGDECDECSDGYFEQHKNDTYLICSACHISCKDLCSEGGPKGCDECKPGWTQTEEDGCKDIDECSNDEKLCAEDKYCLNTAGSYSCFGCHNACVGCTGSGDRKCKECSVGYVREEDRCKDVDECAQDNSLCTAQNEMCFNEPGTYSCKCKEGYQRNSDEKCVKKPKDKPKPIHQPPGMDRKKKKTKSYYNKNAPSFMAFTSILAGFGLCLYFSRGNKLIIFPLTGVISVFVFWYASFF